MPEAMSSAELQNKAAEARERGNTCFKASKHAEANVQYASALELLQQAAELGTDEDGGAAIKDAMHKCRLNRATCLLKLQGYGAAGNEALTVIKEDAANAKAHYRLAQASEAVGDLARAKTSYAEAIKLNPAWKEPRAELEALRTRCKTNERLEQGLQDMSLVEARGLRSLAYADIKTTRTQMELLLKDARGLKEQHWEIRALLALALVCEDEGECEAAHDYLNAARRRIDESGDRRAELYYLQTTALVLLDQGSPDAARPLLEGALLLAEEMCEVGLSVRRRALSNPWGSDSPPPRSDGLQTRNRTRDSGGCPGCPATTARG